MGAEPLYPFGHGLSYTTFDYANFKISSVGKGAYSVTCDVRNSGSRAGDEVVQLYLHQQVASVLRVREQLIGFSRVSLGAGESKTVSFSVGFNELSMLNRQLKRVVEPGNFDLMVGSSSADIRQRGVLTVK